MRGSGLLKVWCKDREKDLNCAKVHAFFCNSLRNLQGRRARTGRIDFWRLQFAAELTHKTKGIVFRKEDLPLGKRRASFSKMKGIVFRRQCELNRFHWEKKSASARKMAQKNPCKSVGLAGSFCMVAGCFCGSSANRCCWIGLI